MRDAGVRFYLDEDLSHQIAEIARRLGVDVLSSHECGRNGLPDEVQLRLAAAEGRCYVTKNRDDFIVLSSSFAERQEPHAGLLIVPRSIPGDAFSRIAHALVNYTKEKPNGLLPYTIDYLRG